MNEVALQAKLMQANSYIKSLLVEQLYINQSECF